VPGPDGTVVTRVQAKDQSILEVPAHFVIDCTGLESDIREHRLYADLFDPLGRPAQRARAPGRGPQLRGRGHQSEPGTIYAAGTMTLGSYFAGVDTFLGLQYAAVRIMDDLAKRGFIKKMGPARSTSQWIKWARGKELPK
jgi:hypothetical protein